MKSAPITKRFRGFPTATLTFDNPLFVVRRNGSGKSNLSDVFNVEGLTPALEPSAYEPSA